MKSRDIPNLISIIRILLVVPIVYLIFERQFGLALILMFIAGVSDGLDGYLAKRNNWVSRLGSLLDPLADKVLLVCCYLTLGMLGEIPIWLVVCVLLRDVVIVVGGVSYHYSIGQFEMQPTLISKCNTFFQIVLVLTVIFSLGAFALPAELITILIYIVLMTTVSSGLQYIWVWSKRARQAMQSQNNQR